MIIKTLISIILLFLLQGCVQKEEVIVYEPVIVDESVDCETNVLSFTGRNIVLSYDDTPKQDYTKLFELHKALGIPAELGVWLNKLSYYNGVESDLTLDELNEMVEFGFDLVSHTTFHTSLGDASLLIRVNAGDIKIRTNINGTFLHSPNLSNDYIIESDDAAEHVRIESVGSDASGSFIKLSKPLQNSYPPYSKLKVTEEIFEEEVIFSKHELENLGYKINHISYPYGLVSEENINRLEGAGFSTGRLAIPKRNWDNYDYLYFNTLNNVYQLNSLDFAYADIDYIESILKKSRNEKNIMLILFSHSWDNNFTAEKLIAVYNLAKEYGYNFTTRDKALKNSCIING